jgi:hypothetical protein
MFATLLDEPDEINRQLGRYLAVGPSDVREVSAALLVEHNRVVLTYVPASGAGVDDGEDAEDAGEAAGEGPGGPLQDDTTEEQA